MSDLDNSQAMGSVEETTATTTEAQAVQVKVPVVPGAVPEVPIPSAAATTHAALKSKTKYPFYPGDLICFDVKKPYEWTPWYGNIVAPKSARNNNDNNKDKEGNWPADENDETWNYDDGITTNTLDVHWCHSNREGTVLASELGLVDRHLPMGQRVKREDGIRGTVSKTIVKAAVQVLNTNHVIDNVPIEHLYPVSPFVRGLEIYYHGWLGIITSVKRNIQCKLDSGPLFTIKSAETDGFMRGDPFWGRGTPCPSVRTRLSANIFKRARFNAAMMRFLYKWMPAVSYFHSNYATTLAVQAYELEVKWLQRVPTSKYSSEQAPSKILTNKDFKDVKPLGLPSYETIGLNSVRMYSVKNDDSILSYTTWFSSFHNKTFDSKISSNYYASNQNTMSRWAANKAYEVPVKMLCRHTIVEVDWDDGIQQRLPSVQIPYVVRPKKTILPIGLVVEPVIQSQGLKKYGIVQYSDDCDTLFTRLVKVKWITPSNETANGETFDMGSNVESIYDLKPHKSYSMFRKGTILFINGHEKGYEIGTVIDMNLNEGQMILIVPDVIQSVSIYPHQVSPIQQRCYWNFFSRSWILDEILLPIYQIPYETNNGHPNEISTPVSLNSNNNNSTAKLQGTLWDEPVYELLTEAPKNHRYHDFELKNLTSEYIQLLLNEQAKLKENVPEGCWVRAYENRMDLLSVLILGPEKTPYEDGLFFFDLQIPSDFPSSPPKIHFVPYTQSLNPYVTDDGDVCISKLDWTTLSTTTKNTNHDSYISTALSKIQELLFTSEPFFCMFNRESELGTAKGEINSRAYNELVFIGVLTSLYKMALKPIEPWRQQISKHLSALLPERINLVKQWLLTLKSNTDMDLPMPPLPNFKLLPISKGFEISVNNRLEKLEQILPIKKSQEPNQEEDQISIKSSEKTSIDNIDIEDDSITTSNPAITLID